MIMLLRVVELINVFKGAPVVRPDKTSPMRLAIAATNYDTGQPRFYDQALARREGRPRKARAHLLCAIVRFRGDPMSCELSAQEALR